MTRYNLAGKHKYCYNQYREKKCKNPRLPPYAYCRECVVEYRLANKHKYLPPSGNLARCGKCDIIFRNPSTFDLHLDSELSCLNPSDLGLINEVRSIEWPGLLGEPAERLDITVWGSVEALSQAQAARGSLSKARDVGGSNSDQDIDQC